MKEKCIKCGQKVKADTCFKDSKGQYWCDECAKETLATAYEMSLLADQEKPYREALIKTLKWAIEQGYCVDPKDATCVPREDLCLKCWLKHEVGEE